jgi:hypothetical protein
MFKKKKVYFGGWSLNSNRHGRMRRFGGNVQRGHGRNDPAVIFPGACIQLLDPPGRKNRSNHKESIARYDQSKANSNVCAGIIGAKKITYKKKITLENLAHQQ